MIEIDCHDEYSLSTVFWGFYSLDYYNTDHAFPLSIWVAIRFYCKRGNMENFIKECKSGFDMSYVNSSSQIVNANRVQIHALAYNLFNWFRRLVLPEAMRKDRIDTVRLKLLKIAVRTVRSARYVHFKLCSFCPFQDLFFMTLFSIHRLRPQLE